MNLHEYQSKELFLNAGIPVLKGAMAASSVKAKSIAEQLGGDTWVIKAQVHAGGRGKAGGVKITNNINEVESIASSMLGSNLITKQTDQKGLPVDSVYVECGTEIRSEFYLSLLIDRAKESWTFIASSEGGVDIEAVADKTPNKILKYTVNPIDGLSETELSHMATELGFMNQAVREFIDITTKLFVLAKKTDANLIEINPLVINSAGHLIALDSKISIDSNALFRQEVLMHYKDPNQENALEAKATENDLSYVSLDGDIACMVNGAGLAMATMDLIKLHGGEPANFLDVGGGATTERVKVAFEIIMENPNVKGILINIFGGIVRCDVIASGIIEALKESNIDFPIVVRLEGTNVDLAKTMLAEAGSKIISADDLTDAAIKIVQSVKGSL
jgi:succinyl-CoA synthetase beta subunit